MRAYCPIFVVNKGMISFMAIKVSACVRRLAAFLLALVLCLPSAALGEELRYLADFEYLRTVAPATVAWL